MLKSKVSQDRGFSLVELMIGITMGLVIVSGVLTVFVGTAKSSSDTLRSSKLNQELNLVMDVMVHEIRRAGYWDDDDLDTAPATPYSVAGVDLDTATAGCILYSYDIDENDSNPPDAGDRFGFKLENNAVRIRSSGNSASDCSNGSGNWETITDDNVINIDTLIFSTANSRCLNASTKASWNSLCTVAATIAPPAGRTYHFVEVRQVDITLTGSLVADPNISKTITESIRIRNDRIYDQT